MRLLHVYVPCADAARVLALARRHDAFAPSAATVRTARGDEEALVLAHLPNDRVGAFAAAVEREVDGFRMVLFPPGTIPLEAPLSRFGEQVRHVARRSTLEVAAGAVQSIGSWKGLLLYAVLSGLVAAYGVLFDRGYLLTAAMLIAPLGGPAMVCVVAAALGDRRLFARGALRFAAGVATLVATAVALGFAYGLERSTPMMAQTTSLSSWSALLGLAGGAAGAQAQVQSDRDSLVTGTATGFLVAVSLSPPAAVLGLALVLGRWDYVGVMAFLLAQTFASVVAGGWLALHLAGVRPGDVAARPGDRRWRTVLAGAAVAVVVALASWQSRQSPALIEADLARDAVEVTRRALSRVPSARYVEGRARFTRPEGGTPAGDALLLDLTVQRTDASVADRSVEALAREAATAALGARMPNVTPFVKVTVLPP